MDQHTDLRLSQAELTGGHRVEHLRHGLDLQEVVAGAKAADLMQSPVDRAAGDLGEVSVIDRAVILAPVEVTLAAMPTRDRVGGTAEQQLFHLGPPRQVPDAAAPGAAGDRDGQPVHDLAKHWSQFVLVTLAASSRTPQEISNPTPSGETTPPSAVSVAAGAFGPAPPGPAPLTVAPVPCQVEGMGLLRIGDTKRDGPPGKWDAPPGEESAAADKWAVDWRASLRRAGHACCCPARPAVVVIMLPALGRPDPVELLLCGHHYWVSRQALVAAGAAVFDTNGAPLTQDPLRLVRTCRGR